MRVLVTGGAGLIGSHTVDALLARGHAVRILDSLELPTHTAGRPTYLAPEAEFIQADVRDRAAVRSALQGIDAVVHLAATGGFTPRLAEYMSVNSVGTAQLLELIRDERLPVRKIVVASSIAVYGESQYRCAEHGVFKAGLRPVERLARGQWEMPCPVCQAPAQPLPTSESTPVDPATAYAISKYDQERMVLVFGRDTGIPTVALRYFVTYGPRQSLHNPYTGVCTIFASRVANGLPMVIYEDGLQSRDFIFVKDVARANVFVLEQESANHQVFNVGTGQSTSMLALAETLKRCLGGAAVMEKPGKFRPADVRHMVADTSRLQRLGYRAETSLEDGLRQYVAWLREQGPLPEYFSRAQAELQAAGVVRSVR
jgi:dTDP-L-rhamnose 4-epimerase